MKALLSVLTFALLLASCSSSGSKTEGENSGDTGTEKAIPAENLKLVRLDVKGMTCEGCENAVVKSIESLEGIQEASASHTAEEAVIKYDATKTDVAAISRAVADAGYSVEGKKL